MVRQLILDKLKEKRLSMKEVSLRLGKNDAYIQQFLKRGVPAQLDEDVRGPLAGMLGIDEDLLRGPSSKLPKREYVKGNPTAHESLVVGQDRATIGLVSEQNAPAIMPGAQLVGDKDLPVFGTAQGGSGALIVTDQPVDWVVRPDPLLRVRDGYGMIVTGDSMAPMHRSGSTALVNPHLPPRNGDTCVFRHHADDGAVTAIIKELRRYNDHTWFVRQYSPKKDFVLKRSEWQVCHVTVGNYFGR